MPKEALNTNNLENQNSIDSNDMSQLTEMPDFEQHLKQQTEAPELKYNSVEKVSKNFDQALIDMGLSENFAKNAALQRIIEKAKYDFIRSAANTQALNTYVSFEQNSLQSEFVRDKHNYSNLIQVNNPNQFTVTASEQYSDTYGDAREVTHSMESATYTLRGNGWLRVDGHSGLTSTMANHEQLMHKEHDTFNSQTFTRQEYAPDGQEVRAESQTFTGNYNSKNKSYSDDTMLENPNFMRDADGVPSEIVKLERTGEKTMHVFIEKYDQTNGKRTEYSAEENINGEHGYQDLTLLNDPDNTRQL